MISELSQVLRWIDHTVPLWAYQIHLERLVHTLCALSSPDRQGGSEGDPEVSGIARTMGALHSLPPKSFLRIVAAPETFYRLLRAGEDALHPTDVADFLSRAVQAEKASLGEDIEFREGVWSALGDRYFPPGWHAGNRSWSLETRAVEWCPERPYEGPSLRNGVPVDFASPYACRALHVDPRRGLQLGPTIPYAPAQIQSILGRLNGALEILEAMQTTVYTFVQRFVGLVQLRQDTRNEGFFTSASSNAFIGRTVLVNAHLEGIDTARLADALVHEAIHSLLYRIEQESPFVLAPTSVDRVRLVSPWTGGLLKLHAYLHACLVWYGLVFFWLQVRERQGLPASTVDHYLNLARRGFSGNAIEDGLRPVISEVRADVRELLRTLIHDVQEACA